MIDTILQYTQIGTPRPLINWTRMLTLIQQKTSMYTEAMVKGSSSIPPWVTKIMKILSDVPVDLWLSMEPAKRYATVLMECDSSLLTVLVPNYTVPSLTNNFVTTNNTAKVQEYLIPVRSQYPLLQLPLGKNISHWKDVHPLHMLYNDSPELCGNIYRMQYQYKKEYPSLLIMSVDIPSLVFKYLAYAEEHKTNLDQLTFIHEHLMDNFYSDCVRCWVFETLNRKLKRLDIPSTPGLIIDPGVVGLALRDVDTYLSKIRSKNISVGDFLTMPWLPGDKKDGTILHYLHWYQDQITFLDYRQAKYLSFFSQFPVTYFLMHLYDMNDRANDRFLKKQLFTQLSRINRSGVFDLCHNSKLRRRIHRDMRELLDLSRPDEVVSLSDH